MSKIKKITVSNLKAVSALTADFNGMTCIITGGNNKGKSSFLKSLTERLRGSKPGIILKQGEKEGFSELELTTGEKFIWNFDGKKEKLTFISERNIKSSVTKDLSTFYFPPVFDVDEFLNSGPKKQKETLQKLTGIEFTEIDRQYKFAYDERTFANKRVVEEKARLVQIEPDAPKEITPTDELEKELAGIDAHNMVFTNSQNQLNEKNFSLSENEKDIIELRERIKIIEKKNSVLNAELLEIDVWLDSEENKIKDKSVSDTLQEKIAKAKEDNKIVEANKKAAEQIKLYNSLVTYADKADKEVKRIEQEKLDVIKNASMPEGFGFNEDGITYKGFEFTKEQLSSSGIYIAALKLAAIGLGEVKTLHFDASFLDNKSLSEIETWANENNLQLLIEQPDRSGGEIEYHILSEIK